MKISIGADHRGFSLKEFFKKEFAAIDWVDCGSANDESSDYPLFARAVCKTVLSGASPGVLICGSGIGMSIAANRFVGIYAALCLTPQMACMAKEDDNANILVLPADFISFEGAAAVFMAWHQARFKGGKYAKRLALIDGQTAL